MLLRRLFAVLVSVGLVLAATVVRARLFPDEPDAPALDELRVACVEELASVCDELRASGVAPMTEPAVSTLARFTQPDPGVDVWVTVEPWPALAADARSREGLTELTSASSEVLARSPLLLAARADRFEAIADACEDGEVTWRCIGDLSGDSWSDLGAPAGWGVVDVAFNAPAETAEGLLVLAQITSDYFDGAPVTGQGLRDPDYFAWMADLGRSANQVAGQTPLERMLLTGGADVEFTGVIEGTAAPLLQSAPARAERIVLRDVGPPVTADVRVVGYGAAGEASVADIADVLSTPLADNGWRTVDAASSESASDDGAAGRGPASPAVLEALRQTWTEVSNR